MFSTHLNNFLPFSSNLKLSSAHSFSLEESKILLFGKGLKQGCQIQFTCLTLYHTNLIITQSKMPFQSIVGKGEMLETSVFYFSHNVFCHSLVKIQCWSWVCFVVCKCFHCGHVQNFVISMGESNTVVSAYMTYWHLQQYCSHPSIRLTLFQRTSFYTSQILQIESRHVHCLLYS